jgi:O-antigen/teichoic acid export membrane protein
MQAVDVRPTHDFAAYLKLRLIGATVAILITAAVAVVVGASFEVVVVTILLALAKAGESLSDVCHGYFEQHQDVRLAAISLIVRGALSVLALAGVYSFTGELAWSVAALALVWIGIAVLYDLPAVARCRGGEYSVGRYSGVRPQASLSEMRAMARQSAPLGVAAFLTSLHLNAPRYVIEHAVSTEALGVFAAQSSIVVAAVVVVHSLNRALTPEVSRTLISGSSIRPLVTRIAALSLLAAAVWLVTAWLAGRQVLHLAFGGVYAENLATFGVLAVAGALMMLSSTFSHALLALGQYYHRVAVQGVAIVAALLGSYWLAPDLGMVGAALGYAVSVMLKLVMEMLLFVRATAKTFAGAP